MIAWLPSDYDTATPENNTADDYITLTCSNNVTGATVEWDDTASLWLQDCAWAPPRWIDTFEDDGKPPPGKGHIPQRHGGLDPPRWHPTVFYRVLSVVVPLREQDVMALAIRSAWFD